MGLGRRQSFRQLGNVQAWYCIYLRILNSITVTKRYHSAHHPNRLTPAHTTGRVEAFNRGFCSTTCTYRRPTSGTWSVLYRARCKGKGTALQEDSPKGTTVFECNPPKDSAPAKTVQSNQPNAISIARHTQRARPRVPAHRLRARISSVMSFMR